VAAQLDRLAQMRHAELLLVELVNDHRVGPVEVVHRALDEVPRLAHRTVAFRAHHHDAFPGAVRPLPGAERDEVRLGVSHPIDTECQVTVRFRERDARLEVRNAPRHDPQVGVRLVNDIDGCLCEPEEQAELNGRQDDRKHDTDQRDGEADAVVKKVAEGQHSVVLSHCGA
jgi:hypothetical protein